MKDAFRKFAHAVSLAVGSPWAFIIAALIIVVWAATGPLFGYSTPGNLSLIPAPRSLLSDGVPYSNTQNRDAKAIHLKLDELLKGVTGARTGMVDLEDMSDEELEELHKEFKRLHERLDRKMGKATKEKKAHR